MPFGLVRVRFCPSASLGVSVFGQGRAARYKWQMAEKDRQLAEHVRAIKAPSASGESPADDRALLRGGGESTRKD